MIRATAKLNSSVFFRTSDLFTCLRAGITSLAVSKKDAE